MTRAAANGLAQPRRRAGLVAALITAANLSACASLPEQVRDYGDDAGPIELSGTPFFPQDRYQCGPAALMTVLTQADVDTTLDSIVNQVYLPGRQGSLQPEMMAATRASGRIPYRIDTSMSAMVAELQVGRSVLVLQNLGVSWLPRWHYAVVIGADPIDDTVTLRSGLDRRRVIDTQTFLRTWRRSGYWGFVVIRPGELPANPDADRYFRAIAALESTGHVHEARKAWKGASERWPDDPVPLFGLANTEFALGNYENAQDLYRRLLDRNPNQISARNNLAHALARQGKQKDAMHQLQLALEAVEDDPAMLAELQDSLAEIRVLASSQDR